MTKQPWSPHEDALIVKHYYTDGIAFLKALMPNRTRNAISQRSYMLRPKNPDDDSAPLKRNDPLQLLRLELAELNRAVYTLVEKRSVIERKISQLLSERAKHSGCARRVA